MIGAVEEERDSDGSRFVVEKYRPDYAVIGEPNQRDRIALGYKGSAWASVTLQRGQAHTVSGDETAAEAAVELWLKIESLADSFNLISKRYSINCWLPCEAWTLARMLLSNGPD